MKYIEKKKPEDPMFGKWHKAGGWDASEPGSKIFNPKAQELKHEVKKLLLNEQGHICCYCEERITETNSHIEHLLPRGQFPKSKQDYTNLLCSCDYPKSCGHSKGKSTITVSPLQKICEDAFRYDDNGKVLGNDQDSTETIRVLQLDCEQLKAARRMIIDVFLNTLPEDITVSEYDDWIDDYLKPDSGNRFRPFWTVVKFIAQKYRSCIE